MSSISRLLLAAVVAVAAMAIGVSMAAANSGEIVAHEGAESHDYVGDIEATSDDSIFRTPDGDVNCDDAHATGEVTQSAVSGADTVIGELHTLVFTHDGGDPECEDTLSLANDCQPFVEPGALEVNADEAHPQLIFNDVEALLDCQTFLGEVDCHYTADQITGEIQGSEVAVNAQHLEREDSSSLCPEEELFSATFHLRTDPGGDEVELALD